MSPASSERQESGSASHARLPAERTACETYEAQSAAATREIDRLMSLSTRIGQARVATSLPGIGLILADLFEERMPWGTWQLGALLLLAFLALATWQEHVLWSIDRWQYLRIFYRRMVARMQRDWQELPPLASEPPWVDFQSDSTRDLDVFGDRSLYRWCSLAATATGARQLASWLTQWVEISVLEERQRAVRELASDRPWRMAFWERLFTLGGATSPEQLAKWGNSEPFFTGRAATHALSWLGPAVVLAGLGGLGIGLLAASSVLAAFGFFLMLAGVAINLLLTMTIIGRIHDLFVRIGGASRELQSLAEVFSWMETSDHREALLRRLESSLRDESGSATAAIGSLQRRMRFAGLQRNPLFFVPYLFLQLLFLWDVRVLESLERWRVRHGRRLMAWVEAVGQMEALASAAAIADEYPEWAFPCWSAGQTRNLSVEHLSHPLIPDAQRVGNDLVVEERRPLLLVTGSNMAGKSTLLRSLGVNTLLSRLGAPVACRSWTGPNFQVGTSIRVQDSLQDGVSFFMAELRRLRSLVDLTRAESIEAGRPMLVLLDEILQGTNSRERQIAVEGVLEQFVELRCLVAASTHDLELAGIESLQRIAQVVHFREYFVTQEEGDTDGQREVMRFDYKMRPGVTPTTNALRLLEMVGLKAARRDSK